jgi:hypothetical protein
VLTLQRLRREQELTFVADHQVMTNAGLRWELPRGGPARGLWQSPGCVNLIGEFTDYNDGHALPFAID